MIGYNGVASLGRLWQRPIAALMTLGVIAISLALPAGLYVALSNLQAVSSGWHDAGEVTAFLKASVDEQGARQLTETMRAGENYARVHLMSPDEALAEFRRLSGYGEALDALEENPLPAVLVLTPARPPANADAARALVAQLEEHPEVDFAQYDVAWLIRFRAILEVASRVVWVVAALLVLAVLLVVGNTIRLDIENRRDEIEITKLIGATDRFIRRPLLYTGFWYGLLGGVVAILVVEASLALIAGPVSSLAGAYQSAFTLHGLGAAGVLLLCAGGALVGWAGAWLAAGRHLAAIQP